jgi:hypothetical protein
LCRVLDDSPRGLRAFRSRPASRRQYVDMVVLAQIKEQSRLSLGSYGRPRMTEEFKEVGVAVGHRCVRRLKPENGTVVERTRKFKLRQGQNLIQWIKFPAARRTAITGSTSRRICWTATSRQNGPIRNALSWFAMQTLAREQMGDISYIWTHEDWLYLAPRHRPRTNSSGWLDVMRGFGASPLQLAVLVFESLETLCRRRPHASECCFPDMIKCRS